MGKKGSWFSAIKRVFIPNHKEKPVNVSEIFLSMCLDAFSISKDFKFLTTIGQNRFYWNIWVYVNQEFSELFVNGKEK